MSLLSTGLTCSQDELRTLAQLFLDHRLFSPRHQQEGSSSPTTATATATAPLPRFEGTEAQWYVLHRGIAALDKESLSSATLPLPVSFEIDRPVQPGEVRTEEDYHRYLLCFRLAWNHERARLMNQLLVQKEEFEANVTSAITDLSLRDDLPKKPKKTRKVPTPLPLPLYPCSTLSLGGFP